MKDKTGDLKMPVPFKGVKEIGWEGMEWIHLAQVRDQWQALMNMVINHVWIPQMAGICWIDA
jgi:hypothetical protein